jgi:aspartate/methionine/tyrosine aminotransferase
MTSDTVKRGEAATSLRYKMMELASSRDDLISLGRGDPDLDTSSEIWQGALRKMEARTDSSPVRGLGELREAIARRYLNEKGLTFDPDREILIANGGQEALFFTMLTLVDPGDRVATPDPRYSSYDQAIGAAGGEIVEIPTGLENDFVLQPEDVRTHAAGAKVLVLVNPSNPTGALVDADGSKALAQELRQSDIIVISDEIYESIVYDGKEFRSLASCDGMRDRTITLSGFSKSYAMTGFRVGYLLGDASFISAVEALKAQLSGPCPLFSQYAALSALEPERDSRPEFLEIYSGRRAEMMAGLDSLQIPYGYPAGGLFLWADVSRFEMDAEHFCYELLDKTGVLMFPGRSFGERWKNWVRISLLAPKEQIAIAFERMASFVTSLSP